MGPLSLVMLASSQAHWLAARQKVIAENVAQSNTPGYRAGDLRSFSETLERTGLAMQATRAGHVVEQGKFEKTAVRREATPWDVTHSGNSVSLDQQMLKANEVYRAYALNASVVRAFSRMLSASVKA